MTKGIGNPGGPSHPREHNLLNSIRPAPGITFRFHVLVEAFAVVPGSNLTLELTRRRDFTNACRISHDAKHAHAARIQRLVRWRVDAGAQLIYFYLAVTVFIF